MEQEKVKNEILKVVVAQLATEEYGFPISQVESLVRVPDITRIPGMPDFVEGVINLRGRIIPIIDLRKRFSLPAKECDEKTRIAVVTISGQSVGLLVDGVSEVINLLSSEIDSVPAAISQIGVEHLKGIGKSGDRLILLFDLEKVLSEMERNALKKISGPAGGQ